MNSPSGHQRPTPPVIASGMTPTSECKFFLADRSLPWWTVAGSVLMTNISAVQFVGLNGSSYQYGVIFIAWELFAIVGIVAAAKVFLPCYFARGVTTVTEVVGLRFGENVRRFTAAIFLISLGLVYLPTLVYSGSIILSAVTGLESATGWSQPQTLTTAAVAIVVLGNVYLLLGGMRFIAVSDTLVAVGFIGFSTLFLGLCLVHLGDGSLETGLGQLFTRHRERWNPFGRADSPLPADTLFTGMVLVNVQVWGTSQMILQRALSARSLADAQKGMLAAAFAKLIVPLFVIVPGMIGFLLWGDTVERPDQIILRLAETVLPGSLQAGFAVIIFLLVVTSFNSGIHSAVTLFTRDLAPAFKLSAQRKLLSGGVFGLLLSVAIAALVPRYYERGESFFSRMKQLDSVFSLLALILVVFSISRLHYDTRRVMTAASISALAYLGALLTLAIDGPPPTLHWLHGVFLAFGLGCTVVWLGQGKPAETLEPPGHAKWSKQEQVALILFSAVVLVYLGCLGLSQLNPG